jgi:hypothetical protein
MGQYMYKRTLGSFKQILFTKKQQHLNAHQCIKVNIFLHTVT